MKPDILEKPIATWLSMNDYKKLQDITNSKGVTVAAFLRAIVIDAIADEEEVLSRLAAISCQKETA